MLKKVFTLKVHWGDGKRIESWETEGNVPPLLCDRFAKGEREMMVTVWNSATMYSVTNVRSYQVTKVSLRPSHAKFCKTDNASVQKHVRWIFVMFHLFI